MKVFYKKSVFEKFIEEHEKAARNNKEIEKVILTKNEARRLKRELSWKNLRGPVEWDVPTQEISGYIFGVRVETE